jgi:hypothetical protein
MHRLSAQYPRFSRVNQDETVPPIKVREYLVLDEPVFQRIDLGRWSLHRALR